MISEEKSDGAIETGRSTRAGAIITLTTDFGPRDNFVGVMKGVILGINPQARIVDLVHDLPAHDVAQAAFSLLTAYSYFPEGTIHVAVVDPGVGTGRALVAIEARGQTFLAPDNGLLSYIMDQAGTVTARRIENPDLRLPRISRTFHGRDILAPAAAHLSRGFPFDGLGPETSTLVRLEPLQADVQPAGIRGRVLTADRFGNLITNIRLEALEAFLSNKMEIKAGPSTITSLSASYGQVEPGRYLAIIGSSGFLEIARNQGRAESHPDLTIGTLVTITFETV